MHQIIFVMSQTDVTMSIEESADDEEIMRSEAHTRFLKERKAVNNKLRPFKKGGKTIIHEASTDRWVIKIPRPLQEEADGAAKVTADTEQEAYHKVYVLLCDRGTTLREMFERAMVERDKDQNLTDQTQQRVRRDWHRYYEDSVLADRPIAEIQSSEIDVFLRNLAPAYTITRNAYVNIRTVLNIAYDYAVSNNIVQINTARQVRPSTRGKFKSQSEGTYTDEQRNTILRYIEAHEKWNDSIYYAAIYIMFHLCARVGEIKALRWTDYDPVNATINIEREVVTRGGRQVEVNHTKGGEHGARKHPLAPKAIALLEHLRETATSEFIFPSEQGKFLRTDKFNERLKYLSKWTGVPYQSSHKIRFWSVTALCRATGGDIVAVGALAGHHCEQTTLHYIRRVQQEDTQNEAARAVFA